MIVIIMCLFVVAPSLCFATARRQAAAGIAIAAGKCWPLLWVVSGGDRGMRETDQYHMRYGCPGVALARTGAI